MEAFMVWTEGGPGRLGTPGEKASHLHDPDPHISGAYSFTPRGSGACTEQRDTELLPWALTILLQLSALERLGLSCFPTGCPPPHFASRLLGSTGGSGQAGVRGDQDGHSPAEGTSSINTA